MKKADKRKLFNLKTAAVVLATTILTGLVASVDMNSLLYKTSVLEFPEHAPFDGTVYPVKKVPNWANLKSDRWKLNYSELNDSELIDTPYYDPSQLSVPTDQLKWGNPVDNSIRNAKITYSVPYMGNYKLDGQEYSGSHLAVDIKVPEGTPVVSIANGTVIKASNQSSGFGQHVVIQHNNFPSLDDKNKKETYFSSYSHLSQPLVSVGDVVSKGEQIGLSGQTGTATTPHVHFQIDNSEAPWHPFWPFTWKEAQDAGLDFFSAINEGLGQELAKKTTINPMKYVQTYMNHDGSVVSTESNSTPAETYVDETKVEVEVDETDNEEEETVVSQEEVATANTDTDVVAVVEETESTEEKTEVVDVVEEENSTFKDVSEDSEYFDAVEYLSDKGIVKGFPDGTFRLKQKVTRVESLKLILEGISAAIENGDLPFTDVSSEAWYSGYLYTAYQREIVNGDPSGTFRPNDTVNKAEFLKILFMGLQVDINPNVEIKPFIDVEIGEWYAPYFTYAKELKIFETDGQITPSVGMTRGEIADAMYRLMKLSK
ncbi:MAG: S-layer homology domain-containing protein [Patescibacteria group bacterium]